MLSPTQKLIYPCPFSKGYGIPEQQAWTLLKIFYLYRFVIANLLFILFITQSGPSLLGEHNLILYRYSSLSYLCLTLVSGVGIIWRWRSYAGHAQILIFTDIVIITLIMHASGGLASGMGLMLVVSIAAGGLLIGGRCAMLFAALASIAILSEQIYAHQTEAFATTSYTYAGMLGAVFFAIAFLAYHLAKHSETSQRLSVQREQTIFTLQELNQNIIQHLQAGIIITNKQLHIRMVNVAAEKILNLAAVPKKIVEISSKLENALQTWLQDNQQNLVRIQLPQQTAVNVRFTLLPTQQEEFYMLMLEDNNLYNQRLQHSKLASLGRLTASIAHEIRNPLGAISHAGQLLSESPELNNQDLRLTEIIQKHCNRVNQIIESILQLSRRKPSFRERINLQAWLETYLINFKIEHAIADEQMVLQLEDEPAHIEFDPGQLKQILDNLSTNAIKYGKPETKPIEIRLRWLQSSPCIEVVDSGPGINKEHLEHLFEPFFTGSATGTGLGLYISRELAELNKAKLHYYFDEKCKSCFRLQLTAETHA